MKWGTSVVSALSPEIFRLVDSEKIWARCVQVASFSDAKATSCLHDISHTYHDAWKQHNSNSSLGIHRIVTDQSFFIN